MLTAPSPGLLPLLVPSHGTSGIFVPTSDEWVSDIRHGTASASDLMKQFFRFQSQFGCTRLLSEKTGLNFPGKCLRAERPIPDLVDELCDVIVWAVVHHRTLPHQSCAMNPSHTRLAQRQRMSGWHDALGIATRHCQSCFRSPQVSQASSSVQLRFPFDARFQPLGSGLLWVHQQESRPCI